MKSDKGYNQKRAHRLRTIARLESLRATTREYRDTWNEDNESDDYKFFNERISILTAAINILRRVVP